ncbi:hypothetical protein SteCoe_14264 [Stentor coeruleus]|uniref:Uncharacterized protein n=1 Tax=Stentor coeruleus TaxID=5963 RepID=A0A1R2C6J2_9CILI|nr:hypothetical protein SteCoe_14264 [Stentor coeruleus]
MNNSFILLSICILATQVLSIENPLTMLQEDTSSDDTLVCTEPTSTCSELELDITCGTWDCSVKLTNNEFDASVDKVYEDKVEMTITDLCIYEGDCEIFIVTVTCSDSNECPVTSSEVTVEITFISETTEIFTFVVPLEYGIIS